MSEQKVQNPDYSNWVSMRLLYGSGAIAIVFLVLSLAFTPLIVGAILFTLVLAYFAYARWKFSPRGGDLQGMIWELVLRRLDWDGVGQALDIGCGNAPLAIRLAKRFPAARVTGIDYWGGMWDYSKGVCERNAESEGVADRTKFQRASASTLPFEDGSFDAAVSNLAFHEVGDATDKRKLVKEALRVVKKGGKFAFQDLFLMKRMYGEIDDLLAAAKSWGIESAEFIDTSHSDFIPKSLRNPIMTGSMGILFGKK